MDIEQALAYGSEQYRDVLDTLRSAGFIAHFTQTGGMCAAIEVTLERGILLVTDASEELPWSRSEQFGWGVGFYETNDVSDGPVEYADSPEDRSSEALMAAVRECLRLTAIAVSTRS